ncbi:hemolytic protein HlpA [Prevotella sp. P5-50]|uniref:hemolytic protein HlpA n=1 Tax=Prevotella sp. P5-50 TaxID=2024217 RepID=UPI000B9659FF|nr:hemolytic protein HlpA [Prevotella sp. P5-50]OYP42633.1 hemolytic protein HlpA [Prevotella sp. P5-50]
MDRFDIPVVLIIFKRHEKILRIIEQVSRIKPSKVYLLADGPRNAEEEELVRLCREKVEKAINWDCELIKNYSPHNRGVYRNIGEGAQWVFAREKKAIFLEDDNYPEISFFEYCKELLEKYENDERVLWICGTNYLEEYEPQDGSDYMFTKLMLPCGWASWSNKFLKYYEGKLDTYRDEATKVRLKGTYTNTYLYKMNKKSFDRIHYAWDNNRLPNSWDYQMAYAIRANNLFGISPKFNQIRNIGADNDSIHGGTSMTNIMTSRFCENRTKELSFPLKHPRLLLVDTEYEKKMEKIIIPPFKGRVKLVVGSIIKYILRIPQEETITKDLLNTAIRHPFRRKK